MKLEIVKGFDYRYVELKTSHWEKQREETIECYLSIDNDELLHYFRTLAGISSKVNGLVGWYGANASTFGQKLGALAKLYIVTGDRRLKEKAIYLSNEWGECAKASRKVLDINDTYVYEKLLGGFVDMYEYLHYEKALAYISDLTDSAMRRFDTEIKRDGLQDEGLFKKNMIEWYTLPENLYRAYQLTGNEKYKVFAKEWDYNYFWDKLRRNDFDIGPRHAYSHVNSLSSAAKAYEVTGDETYLEAMKIAYEEITSHHIFATGGYGPAECVFPDEEGYLGDSLKDSWDKSKNEQLYRNFGDSLVGRNDSWGSCEVSCCAWAVFKFCNYLIQYTGDASYGDWVEKMLYNGTGAQIPIEPDGKVMYYSNYFVDGGLKTVEDRRLQDSGVSFEWQCCTGTFPQDVAEYSNLLYYYGEEALYVSQYLPSKVKWVIDGTKVELENYSLYPEEEEIKFALSLEGQIQFAIKFRVPTWAKGNNEVYINGEEIQMPCNPGEWLILDRVWESEDIITIKYEFILRFTPVDDWSKDIVALSYGPLVLCANSMTMLKGDVENPEAWIHKVDEEANVFETDKGHVKGYEHLTRKFKPYYHVPAMEWYYLYNRINAT